MVGALGVVEHQSVGEFLVEEGRIGEEQVFVVVDEGFRKGAMEAFGRSIIFGVFGVGRQQAIRCSARTWAKPASNSEPLSDKSTRGGWGSSARGTSRAARVWRVALRGTAMAKAKALAGSMKVMRSRRMPSREVVPR
jgi:hypothetical protein